MNPPKPTTEVILFYINDKENEIENILPGFAFNRNIKPSEMLELCAKSITKSMPEAKIVLITNSHTSIHQNIENIEVINADDIGHDKLILDLHVFRRQYIQSKLGRNVNLIFTDIDVLINKDLSVIFDQDFDLATTIDPASNPRLNARGLPTDGSLMFNFTGGIYFVKCTQASLNFYDHFLSTWRALADSENFSSYGTRAQEVKTHFLRWWGELHTLSTIFGIDVLNGRTNRANLSGADWLFLPERKYNFAPEVTNRAGTLSINIESVAEVGVVHFRGIRKVFMPLVFNKFF